MNNARKKPPGHRHVKTLPKFSPKQAAWHLAQQGVDITLDSLTRYTRLPRTEAASFLEWLSGNPDYAIRLQDAKRDARGRDLVRAHRQSKRRSRRKGPIIFFGLNTAKG